MPVAVPVWHKTVPIALQWPAGATVCAASVTWALIPYVDPTESITVQFGDIPEAWRLVAASNSTTASLYVEGAGSATVTATVAGETFRCNIIVDGSSVAW